MRKIPCGKYIIRKKKESKPQHSAASVFSFFWHVVQSVMRSMKSGDWVALCGSILLVITLAIVLTTTMANGAPYVEITTRDETFIYDLHISRTVALDGPLGTTTVAIQNNTADVISSPGRRQICVNAEAISQNGQWLACLPNKVFVRIVGQSSRDAGKQNIDALSF